jgi:uncharacterized phage-associated protein
MPTVFDVADYFIAMTKADCKDGLNDDVMTHLKLQKLVYYAQGFCLATLGKPLFEEPLEAWEHGPVCPALYQKYKNYKRKPIGTRLSVEEAERAFSSEELEVLRMVYDDFGCLTASYLRKLSHEDKAWQNARPGRMDFGFEITHEDMKESCEARLIL